MSADSCIMAMVVIKSDACEHSHRQIPSSPSVVVFGLEIVTVGDDSLGLVGVSFNDYKIKAPVE